MSEPIMRSDTQPLRFSDASDGALLPAGNPMPMPVQNFNLRTPLAPERRRRGYWVPRAAVFFGALLMTAAFAYELYGALTLATMTPLQVVFLVLSTLAFSWISFGTLSAAMGFLPLFAGEHADAIDVLDAKSPLQGRCALLYPVYHEDPARIAGAITALAAELGSMDRANSFDVFVLSDTRGEAAGMREERVIVQLARSLRGVLPVYYRRRVENTAKKSGNIRDWVERFGGAYESFIILDGDSIITGDVIVRLVIAMQKNEKAGLIQTVPRLIGGSTLLQKLQQFASSLYGAPVAAGLAFWHRDQGNYWGHNAMIRTRAFAESAGLPELPGAAPFGGHIQSHDFVEAVLLQRAGWGVHMAPSLAGSFEGAPPTIAELAVRDRRWAQGNLQHLNIVARSGLTPMGRVHLAMGACSYLVSVIWAFALGIGVILALQSQHVIPSYFQDDKSLFPIWPVMDPGAAMRLFLATMAVVLLPKALGLILEIKRAARAGEAFGLPCAIAGVATETVCAILIAPVMMMTQTAAVADILMGRDSGWRPQRRDTAAIRFDEALKFHTSHTLAGFALALASWWASPGLLIWMLPVVVGLVLSAPMHWVTSWPVTPALAAVLSTPEERNPPPILERTLRETAAWSRHLDRERNGIFPPLRTAA